MNKCVICESTCVHDDSRDVLISYCIHSFENYQNTFIDLYYTYNNHKYIVSFDIEENKFEIHKSSENPILNKIFSSIIKKEQFTKEFIEKVFDNLIFG